MVNYAQYIVSPEWRAKAAIVKNRAGECALCQSRFGLQVHHRTYERLGHERAADLIVLCRCCHGIHHGTFEAQLQLPFVTMPEAA